MSISKMTLVGLTVIAATVVARDAAATWTLGWADEFVGATLRCSSDTLKCSGGHMWAGPYWMDPSINDLGAPPTWAYVGVQGYSGRTNAKEKVQYTFRDHSSTIAFSITATLSRTRVTAIPAEGTACSSGGGVFVGSVSQTFDSYGGGVTTWLDQSRLLPVFDFSAETASGGTNIGYRATLTATGDVTMATRTGCYKIQWL